ncbi:MAG: BBP7 family outer membrane beta-barrel protein [Planctomycetaceae bacterium]|jgi:hypothetical protein|nr:BBP7 family outer membrane beta-barrel protein [Planctomycetaceae bacterium]
MSLLKLKSFLTGLLLAIIVATTNPVSALEGMRLWAPYQPESFGGNRRGNDGFFAAFEGILWKVDGPKSIPIGYTNPDGSSGSRWAYDGNKTFLQTNSMNTNNLGVDFTLGTRVEFGNRRGHHGWLFSGYGLSDCGGSFSSENGSLVIDDPENLTSYAIYGGEIGFNEIWQKDGTFKRIPRSSTEMAYVTSLSDGLPQVPIRDVGYLWAWFPIKWGDPWLEGRLAPVPLNFARASVSNSVDIMSLELMYTYRTHPFKWGDMEFLAGARYWDFDDKLSFLGQGYEDPYYDSDPFEDNNDNNNNNNNNNNNDSNYGQAGQSNSSSVTTGTVLADTKITGQVRNRIIGPQVGIKFQRRNARWTFGAEGRFMAGINNQSQTVSGYLGSNFIDPTLVPQISVEAGTTTGSEQNNVTQQGVLPYIPIGIHHNTQTFHHHRNKTYFSPGFELQLSAKWQWTDAVGVKVGFNSTIFDNIGRGAEVIEYKIHENGQLFGLKVSKTAVITYGLNFGLDIRR